VSALLLGEIYEASGGESLMMLHLIVSGITLLRRDEGNGGGCTDVVAGSDRIKMMRHANSFLKKGSLLVSLLVY